MYTINYHIWNTKLPYIVFKTTWHSIPVHHFMHFAQCLSPIPNFSPSKRHFHHAIHTISQPTTPLNPILLCNMPIPQLNSLLTKCISYTDVFKQLYNYTRNSHNSLKCIYISSKSLAIFSFIALLIKVDIFL